MEGSKHHSLDAGSHDGFIEIDQQANVHVEDSKIPDQLCGVDRFQSRNALHFDDDPLIDHQVDMMFGPEDAPCSRAGPTVVVGGDNRLTS